MREIEALANARKMIINMVVTLLIQVISYMVGGWVMIGKVVTTISVSATIVSAVMFAHGYYVGSKKERESGL